jgi:hypothetical protein
MRIYFDMDGFVELKAKLDAEIDAFQDILQAIKNQKKRVRAYDAALSSEKRKELQTHACAMPVGSPLFDVDIEEMSRGERQKERYKYYWGAREYLYTSGKPYDLVDLFNIGERDAK